MNDVFWRPTKRQEEPRPVVYAPSPVPPAFRPDFDEHEAGQPSDDEDKPRVVIIDL